MCWNVSWAASADSLVKTWLSHLLKPTPVTVVHRCIGCQCFILLPKVGVIFNILPFFRKLLKEITFDKILDEISKRKKNVHLHYIRLVILHIQVVCFEHVATWKRCCDMQKVCGNSFEDRKRHNVQHNLNVDWRYGRILGYMMILVYAEYFKSIQICWHMERVFVTLLI